MPGFPAIRPWYNLTLGLATLVGRFLLIVPVLALAGSLARKKTVPLSAGSFPVSGVTFTLLLIGTVIIVGALTFFPALSLGPIVEHFLMINSTKLVLRTLTMAAKIKSRSLFDKTHTDPGDRGFLSQAGTRASWSGTR